MSAVAAGLALLLFQSSAGFFEKAPPAVDEALRARITKFYQAHVQGKFRAADEVVAEDSKDAFFSANKTRCYSFEIVEIRYSENFTRATATVACEMDYPAPGFSGIKVKGPLTSLWKLADGQWWYYIDPSRGQRTPFGVMRPGPGQPTSIPPAVASGVRPEASVDVEAVLSWVKPDKRELRFDSARPGRDELTLTNRGPAAATLIMQYPPMPGFEVTLDRREIKQGEAARLTARWEPGRIPPPPAIRVQILVQPTHQVLDLRATFTPEPGR